jgi:tRNA (cytidine/uridine-2'-O-)-methyltransferase
VKNCALHVALMHPEIPGNTGNIGRLCHGIGATLHLVHPLGFDTDNKAARRAGLDYWSDLDRVEHENEEAFLRWADGRNVHLFTTSGEASFTSVDFKDGDVLLFGSESKGVPDYMMERFNRYIIPMPGPIRSLNLANSVAIVSYEALKTVRPDLFGI